MKKHLAPLKDKKEDMELVIGLISKGLSLPGAIEKKLANVEGKNVPALAKIYTILLIKKSINSWQNMIQFLLTILA